MDWLKKFNNLWPGKKDKVEFDNFDLEEIKKYVEDKELDKSLSKKISMLKKLTGDSYDFNQRNFSLGDDKISGSLIYFSGLVSNKSLERILQSMEVEIKKINFNNYEKKDIFDFLSLEVLNNSNTKKIKKIKKLFIEMSTGATAILLDGIGEVLICETRGYETRAVEEPKNEISIRGPKDGFVENIQTNTSLLRKRIKIPNFWLEEMNIGDISHTKLVIAYIKGLANEDILKELKNRLNKINIDQILESGYIQEFITDEWLSPFPQLLETERPDRVTANLVEGRIAILTENTPFVLILPANLNMFIQAPDDYYERFSITSFVRVLRYFAFIISILFPGIYIAILNYHPELMPISLFLRISATREGVPFPLIIESLLMESIFEVLREAGLRLPPAIGSAISIVGALVLGEAAINAGLVSPPMVVVVAITAISSFTIPSYSLGLTARIIRFIFLLLGGFMGMFGIQFGILILIIHLSSLESFGQPYLQPFAPFIWEDIKDSIIRVPWWSMKFRPKSTKNKNLKRQAKNNKRKQDNNGQ